MANVKQYRKVDEITHVRMRISMYTGSTANTTKKVFLPVKGKFEEQEITFNPSMLKLFDEIISNAVDVHLRDGSVRSIDVAISAITGEISVEDDGHGIPVEKHPEYKTMVPEMIFGELRTGSNFEDDERMGAGMNGLGAKLTNILSSSFTVKTCDGKKVFIQKFQDGMSNRSKPFIRDAEKTDRTGTKITFTPDYDFLGCALDTDNLARITKRVWDVAACNPRILVSLNNQRINLNKFEEYAKLHTDSVPVSETNNGWDVVVCESHDDTFHHISFVNGIDTYNGGSHVDDVTDRIVAGVREHIRKKHKIDIKPNNIKQQMMIFINASINAPSFTSQTKEFMSTEPKNYGQRFDVNDKFMRKILKSSVVKSVLAWAEGQRKRQEMEELKKANKEALKNNALKKIPKFDDATSSKRDDCTLYLVEGDAAAKPFLSARNGKIHGVYPLGGKPVNVRSVSGAALAKTDEFQHILTIIGLQVNKPARVEDLRYRRIVIAADFDPDGAHILGLMINMIHQFWPNLVQDGVLHRLKTPLITATVGNKVHEFFSRDEYEQWAKTTPKHKMKYHKGLGGWETKDFKHFITNEGRYIEQLEMDDGAEQRLDLIFDKDKADDRKEWLQVMEGVTE